MPSTIEVVVDPSTFQVTNDGNLTGVVYWIVDGREFPERGWNDFVSVLMNWWCESIYRILNGQSDHEELRFMDGPFSLLLSAAGEMIEISFVERGKSRKVSGPWSISRPSLRTEFVRAATEFVHFAQCQGIVPDDLANTQRICRMLV